MKKYVFVVFFLLILSLILVFPRNLKEKDIEIDYELIENEERNFVYFIKDSIIYGVSVKLNATNKYEMIEEVFLYLTVKSNSIGEEYYTALNFNSKLISYSIRDTNIFLDLNEKFFEVKTEDFPFILSQIYYTYKDLGFDTIYISYNGKIIDSYHNTILSNGISNMNSNFIDLSYSKNTKEIEVIFYYKNDTKSYFNFMVNDSVDEVGFKVDKIIEFLNEEYQFSLSLIDLNYTEEFVDLTLKCEEKDKDEIQKLFDVNISNIKINFIFN